MKRTPRPTRSRNYGGERPTGPKTESQRTLAYYGDSRSATTPREEKNGKTRARKRAPAKRQVEGTSGTQRGKREGRPDGDARIDIAGQATNHQTTKSTRQKGAPSKRAKKENTQKVDQALKDTRRKK